MHYLENIIPVKITDSNTILVTSNDIKHQVLKYRLEHKIIDNLKLMTSQEFEQVFGFESDPERLLFLINNNPWGQQRLKVDIAKQLEIAIFIIVCLDLSEHPLYSYAQALGTLKPKRKSLPNYNFVFYVPRVSDLICAVTNVEYQLAEKEDYTITEYNYYLDEVEATIEAIMDLAQNGVQLENIHLIAPSNYHTLINQVASLYQLPIAIENKLPLLSHEDGARAYKQIEAGQEVDLETIEPLLVEPIINLINRYARFDKAEYWQLIAADFESASVTLNKQGGLQLKSKIDSLYTTTDLENDHFFVLGNYQDGLVSYQLDTNIVGDDYRQQLFTTDQNNKIEDSLLYNLLNNAKNLTASYAVQLLDKEVTLANNLSGCQVVSASNLELSQYSRANDHLRFARANYIKSTFNMETTAYQSLSDYYQIEFKDNRFTPISKTYEQLKLSYTSINDYYKCSYKFYLAHILRIKNGKFDNRKVLIGNIVHYVLENIDSIADLTSASIKNIITNYTRENNISVSDIDRLYFEKFSVYLEAVCVYMKQEEADSGFTTIEREQSFEMELAANVSLVGKIDKILSKIEGDNLFVEIYDYKTGSLNIDVSGVEYGLNMQNLIYFLLLKNYYQHESGDEVLNGTYQHQIKQKLLYDDQEILDTMKIKGYSKIKHDNIFKRTEKIISETEVDELLTKVSDKVEAATEAIIGNQFEINPKIIKGKNESCGYCQYASICNKTINDFKFMN